MDINIWDFYIEDYVSIIDSKGIEYKGVIVCMLGADEVDEGEDYLALLTNEKQVDFYKSDIKDIQLAQIPKQAMG